MIIIDVYATLPYVRVRHSCIASLRVDIFYWRSSFMLKIHRLCFLVVVETHGILLPKHLRAIVHILFRGDKTAEVSKALLPHCY